MSTARGTPGVARTPRGTAAILASRGQTVRTPSTTTSSTTTSSPSTSSASTSSPSTTTSSSSSSRSSSRRSSSSSSSSSTLSAPAPGTPGVSTTPRGTAAILAAQQQATQQTVQQVAQPTTRYVTQFSSTGAPMSVPVGQTTYQGSISPSTSTPSTSASTSTPSTSASTSTPSTSTPSTSASTSAPSTSRVQTTATTMLSSTPFSNVTSTTPSVSTPSTSSSRISAPVTRLVDENIFTGTTSPTEKSSYDRLRDQSLFQSTSTPESLLYTPATPDHQKPESYTPTLRFGLLGATGFPGLYTTTDKTTQLDEADIKVPMIDVDTEEEIEYVPDPFGRPMSVPKDSLNLLDWPGLDVLDRGYSPAPPSAATGIFTPDMITTQEPEVIYIEKVDNVPTIPQIVDQFRTVDDRDYDRYDYYSGWVPRPDVEEEEDVDSIAGLYLPSKSAARFGIGGGRGMMRWGGTRTIGWSRENPIVDYAGNFFRRQQQTRAQPRRQQTSYDQAQQSVDRMFGKNIVSGRQFRSEYGDVMDTISKNFTVKPKVNSQHVQTQRVQTRRVKPYSSKPKQTQRAKTQRAKTQRGKPQRGRKQGGSMFDMLRF